MNNEYLLGATTDNEIVTCNIRLSDNPDGSKRFTASFNVYNIINGNELPSLVESHLDNYDKEVLYDLCDNYDCAPSALCDMIVQDENLDEWLGMSWCINTYSVVANGDEWFFENICAGQHDTRNDMSAIIDQEAYDLVHELWDNYHLKAIGGETLAKAETLIDKLSEIDESEWIAFYIEEHMV